MNLIEMMMRYYRERVDTDGGILEMFHFFCSTYMVTVRFDKDKEVELFRKRVLKSVARLGFLKDCQNAIHPNCRNLKIPRYLMASARERDRNSATFYKNAVVCRESLRVESSALKRFLSKVNCSRRDKVLAKLDMNGVATSFSEKMVEMSRSLAVVFYKEKLERRLLLINGTMGECVPMYDNETGEVSKISDLMIDIWDMVQDMYKPFYNKGYIRPTPPSPKKASRLADMLIQFMKFSSSKTGTDREDCDFLGRKLKVVVNNDVPLKERRALIQKGGRAFRRALRESLLGGSGFYLVSEDFYKDRDKDNVYRCEVFYPYQLVSFYGFRVDGFREFNKRVYRNFNNFKQFILIPQTFVIETILLKQSSMIRAKISQRRGNFKNHIFHDRVKGSVKEEDNFFGPISRGFPYPCHGGDNFCMGDFMNLRKGDVLKKDDLDKVIEGVRIFLRNHVYAHADVSYSNQLESFVQAYPYYIPKGENFMNFRLVDLGGSNFCGKTSKDGEVVFNIPYSPGGVSCDN